MRIDFEETKLQEQRVVVIDSKVEIDINAEEAALAMLDANLFDHKVISVVHKFLEPKLEPTMSKIVDWCNDNDIEIEHQKIKLTVNKVRIHVSFKSNQDAASFILKFGT